MDIALMCALGSGLAFAGVQVALKEILGHAGSRTAGVKASPFVFPALVGLLLPLWAALALGGVHSGLLVWDMSWSALRWPLAWACVMVASSTGFAWLIMRFSLSEVLGYKKGLITLGAAVADVFWFENVLPLATMGAIVCLLGGAMLLGKQASAPKEGRGKGVSLLILAVWCGVVVLQLSFYKRGLLAQPDVLSYAVLAQGLAALCFAGLWARQDVRAALGGMPWRWVSVLLGCVFLGNVMEGFAYKSLPMALVLVVTLLPATLLGAYDLWRGHVRMGRASVLGFGLILAGFLLLLFG